MCNRGKLLSFKVSARTPHTNKERDSVSIHMKKIEMLLNDING